MSTPWRSSEALQPGATGPVRDFDERNDNLSELVPCWPELNDALFWYSVEATRIERGKEDLGLNDDRHLQWPDPYWAFGSDSFRRVLGWVRTRELEDDQLVALSLASRIYRQEEEPIEWHDLLQACVRGDSRLTSKLDSLVGPAAREEDSKFRRKWAEHQGEVSRKRQETARQRSDWIARLKAAPEVVRDPPNLPLGDLSRDQSRLLGEVIGDGLRTDRSHGSAWRALIEEFGEDVASAYRDAAMAHWRQFRPIPRSEGGDTRPIPPSLIFAMAGLAIEAEEVEGFPRASLCRRSVSRSAIHRL